MTNKDVTVLIVGAGPSGLTMALELQRRGISFRIIDKHTKPVTTSNALAVQTRTLEVWEDQGLYQEALRRGSPLKGFNIYADNKRLIHVDFTIIENIHPFILALAQQQTEAMLIEHLQKQNVSIEFNKELVDFNADPEGISVVMEGADGTKETLYTQWMIACDGGHSAVRSKLNIPFLGKELEQHFVLADAKVETSLPSNELNFFLADDGPFFFGRYDKEHTRLIAEVSLDPELKDAKTLTKEQIERLAKSRCSVPMEIGDPVWTSGFWIHERIAQTFRQNNIFLVGDAAHVHSPAGGQGMNTGIQDAYNLAWKLALVIQGKAKSSLLDTYQQERYPVIQSVLKYTTVLTRMMTLKNKYLRKIRNFLLPQLLSIEPLRQKLITNMVELGICYPTGPLIKECMRGGKGPRAGLDMLNVICERGKTLMDYVRGVQHSLIIFTNGDANIAQFVELKDSIKQQYPDLFKFVLINTQDNFTDWNDLKVHDSDLAIHESYQIKQVTLYVIRPDKYIGFRGGMDAKADLMQYLQSTFNNI